MVDIAERFVDLPAGIKPFLAAPPDDVIRLTVGEPGFDTPKEIVDSAIKSLEQGNTKYTRSEGSLELCTASAKRLYERYGIPATPESIIITPGAKQGLLYTFMVTCEPGDEVILLAPAWPSYDIQCRMLKLNPVHVSVKNDDFHPDLSAIENAITDKTKVLVINSPNNPTGAVYTPEEISGLLDIAIRHDLWLVSDEIYARLNWTNWEHLSPSSLKGGAERTIVVTGWSKSFAMTGWRIGLVCGPEKVMKAMGKLQANACSHIPSFLMDAAIAALDSKINDDVEFFKQEYLKRRKILMEGIGLINGLSMPEPEGAFYGFVDISETGMDSTTFATRALKEAKVQLIPGGLIDGGEGFVRISYACDEESLKEGLARIEEWLKPN
ncbi:MAG: aspartate aminotransferase [Euryarchaeota archaeon]|nr:aspartate aminotransferase [Euryarchaeota archaeon]|tara:strand:+ start:12 stop:1157 length:1146 start_codon:yes stop_codon:yes gene_type:complete